MTVYIEYVIADNFIFTALICYLSYKLLKERARWGRIIVASIAATACAVAYPFVRGAVWVILFKLALMIVMCVILYIKLRSFFVHSLCFLVATAIMGGIQFMIGFAVYGDVSAALKLPVSELPLCIFFLPPIALFALSKKIFSVVNEHRLKQNYLYDIKLTVGDKTVALRALLDTGNNVKADKDVVFIGKLTAMELLGLDYFKMNNAAASIDVATAAGNKKIMLIPAGMELYSAEDEHIFIDVQVGIGDIKTNGEYEAILPLSVFKEIQL